MCLIFGMSPLLLLSIGAHYRRHVLTAVENLLAQILQCQCPVVRPPRRLRGHSRIFNFANENRVVSFFNCIDKLAFNKSRSFFENRRPESAFPKRLAANRVAFALERFEKRERLPFLISAENV